jgi:hypothetical protein
LTVNVAGTDDARMRYVVLHHVQTTGQHWDFMIEQPDALATWQLAANPLNAAYESIPARRIQDHRKHYLKYEGDISGGRGSVTRVAEGTLEIESSSEKLWRFKLAGTISGRFQLIAVGDPSWRLEPTE